MLENLFSFIEVFIALSFAGSVSKLFSRVQEIFSSFVFNIKKARKLTQEEEERLEKDFRANAVVLSTNINEDNIPQMMRNKKEILNLKKSRKKNWKNLDKKVKNRYKTIFFNRIALSNALVGILLLLLIPTYLDKANNFSSFGWMMIVSLFQFFLATISFIFDFNTTMKSIAQEIEEWIKVNLNIDVKLLFFIFVIISILTAVGTFRFINIENAIFCNKQFFLSILIIITLLTPFVYYILRAIFVILSNKKKFNNTKKKNREILDNIERKLYEREKLISFTKEVEEAIAKATTN